MKKITKLLVVGLLSLVMVFSAAACSGGAVDNSAVEDNLSEITTVLDLIKAQLGGTNDAVAAVEAAIKAGDFKAALAAISAALTTANTAQQNAINADATHAYLQYLEAQAIAKTGSGTASALGKGYAGVHNLYPAYAEINVKVENSVIVASNLTMDETFFPEVYLTETLTGAYKDAKDADGKDIADKDLDLAAVDISKTWDRFTIADDKDTTKLYDAFVTKSIVAGTGANVGKKANRSVYSPRFIQVGGSVFMQDGTEKTTAYSVYNAASKALLKYTQLSTFAVSGTGSTATAGTGNTALVDGFRTTISDLQMSIANNSAAMKWYVNGLLGTTTAAHASATTNPNFVQALRLAKSTETPTVFVKILVPTKVTENEKEVIKDVETAVGLVAESAPTLDAGDLVANAALYTNGISKAIGGKYWTGTYERGWVKNVAAMEASFPALINQHPAQFAKNATGEFAFNGYITTGATLTDFNDYFVLSQLAYINALTQIITATAPTP